MLVLRGLGMLGDHPLCCCPTLVHNKSTARPLDTLEGSNLLTDSCLTPNITHHLIPLSLP
jgi:hypothetical protein